MRKQLLRIVLLAICTIFANQSFAQVLIGPYIGANLSTVRGDSSSGNKLRAGLNLGLGINFGITDNVFIVTGVGYNMEGTGFNNSSSGSLLGVSYSADNSGHTTFHYLNVPLMLRLQSDGGLFIEAGPDFSYLLATSTTYTRNTSVGGHTISSDTSYTSTSNLNKIDWGIDVGIGFQAPSGPFIRLGSIVGLGNINDASNSDLKEHNLLFQLSIGYMFGGKDSK